MKSSSSNFRLELKRYKRVLTHNWFGYWNWKRSNYSPPSPYKVKNQILLSNSIPNAPWIETGTYLGETTKLLAKKSPMVVSFEPGETHFSYAKRRFRNSKNVKIINSTSEVGLEEVVCQFNSQVNFYFDGHASGDGTFMGSSETPILHELAIVEKYLHKFESIFVAIDDFREFVESDGTYPSHNYLVSFCQKNNLQWKVEQDIFMIKK